MRDRLRYRVWRGYCKRCGQVQAALPASAPVPRRSCPLCGGTGWDPELIGAALKPSSWRAPRKLPFGRTSYPRKEAQA